MVKVIGYLVLGLILSGCASMSRQAQYSRGMCVVSWKDQESKSRFYRGLSLTSEERYEQDLFVPVAENPRFIVKDVLDNQYILSSYDNFDDYELVRKELQKHLVISDQNEKFIVQAYMYSDKRISFAKMREMQKTKKLEPVDCADYASGVLFE